MAKRDSVIKVEHSVVIERPDWEVFTFIANAENEVLWRPRALYVRKTYYGPMGPGATYWYVARRFLGRTTGIIRVIEYEPDRAVTYQGSFEGGVQPEDAYRLEPVPEGTRVTATSQPRLSGLRRLFASHVALRAKAELADDLARLKRLLEDPAKDAAVYDSIRD